MQPNLPPYGPSYGTGAFGPPPGQFGNPFYDPSGPPAAITPAGSGGFALKWLAVGGYACGLVGVAMVAVLSTRDVRPDGFDAAAVTAVLTFGLGAVLWVAGALGWIYASWSFLPPAYRRSASGRAFTPAGAVAWHLVPLYNLYWVFAQNLGYCEAVDAVMVQSGRGARAPKTLATVACVLQVVPYLNFLAAPIAWMAYMFAMDSVKAQLTARPAPRRR